MTTTPEKAELIEQLRQIHPALGRWAGWYMVRNRRSPDELRAELRRLAYIARPQTSPYGDLPMGEITPEGVGGPCVLGTTDYAEIEARILAHCEEARIRRIYQGVTDQNSAEKEMQITMGDES